MRSAGLLCSRILRAGWMGAPTATVPQRNAGHPGGPTEHRELLRQYREAVARLENYRGTRLLVMDQVRRCLAILGDEAGQVVGPERFRSLRTETEALSLEAPSDTPEADPSDNGDPATAWMDAEIPSEMAEAILETTPTPASPEERRRAREALRDLVRALDEADARTPDLHLAIVRAERKLRAFEQGQPGHPGGSPVARASVEPAESHPLKADP